MKAVGISVLNGAVSTIIGRFLCLQLNLLPGVFLLGLAQYNLFRTYYFKMYMANVIFALFYGFFFLPVLLSLIGPEYASKTQTTSRYCIFRKETNIWCSESKQIQEDEPRDRSLSIS